ncbi:DUF2274 domain-containing protein [Rhizobium puerariae]|uniref:DUF2274 domain-containing protein n=1 Tax=Rhizobium puerariae TaxID=1585791 RepID=A0ABV6AG71_9HYPH
MAGHSVKQPDPAKLIAPMVARFMATDKDSEKLGD